MKRPRYTEEQIALGLRQAEGGTPVAMGWTPPHTYGIECQTGDVKPPVTE
jgi:hypothetical protein